MNEPERAPILDPGALISMRGRWAGAGCYSDLRRVVASHELLRAELEWMADYLHDCGSDTADDNIYGFRDVEQRIRTALRAPHAAPGDGEGV